MNANGVSDLKQMPRTSSSSSAALLEQKHEVFSRASPPLVKIRSEQLLPFTTESAQRRIAALKCIFSSTPMTAIKAAHELGIRHTLQRLRLTKSVRNVKLNTLSSDHGVSGQASASGSGGVGGTVVGSLCMSFTTCCSVHALPPFVLSHPRKESEREDKASALVLTGAVDGLITLWDVDACCPLASVAGCKGKQWARVRALEGHPTEPLFFSATMFDHGVSVWRITSDRIDSEEGGKDANDGMLSCLDQARVATTKSDLALVRVAQKAVSDHDNHIATINRLAVDPSGVLLASVSEDATLRLWDVNSGGTLLQIQDGYEGAGGVLGLAFHPDGSLLSSTDRGGRVVTWDIRTGNHAFTTAGSYGGHMLSATCVAWSPCGTRFASGGADAVIHLWDARMLYREQQQAESVLKRSLTSISSKAAPFMFLGHEDVITSLDFYTNPNRRPCGNGLTNASRLLPLALVSTSLDHTLRVWDMDTGICRHTLDAGAPLYAQCRPHCLPTSANTDAQADGACSAAAIFGVGHSKYWFLWDVVNASYEHVFEPAVQETDAAETVGHLEALTSVHGQFAHNSQAANMDHPRDREEDEDEEMAQLFGKPAVQELNLANSLIVEDTNDDDTSEDEMALLRK